MVTAQNWLLHVCNNLLKPAEVGRFHAELQTPQSVSMPSCATMKSNRGVVSGKENRNRSIERFQDMQLLPFQQSAKKTRSFFSGFQDSEPVALISNRDAIEWEAMKFSVRE